MQCAQKIQLIQLINQPMGHAVVTICATNSKIASNNVTFVNSLIFFRLAKITSKPDGINCVMVCGRSPQFDIYTSTFCTLTISRYRLYTTAVCGQASLKCLSIPVRS
ncbi:hypothetical protein CHS0354_020087 [Potamilus streckersoni]|uniref:Uncharacterized protein n=1 Tax=Potamilus streckersoni TaxID=2493646 RepID=A0AAE0SC68_9BIVA|nr:hypothetical protein CHS0354_020087 [Potamilus streckersoni]